MDAKRRTFVKLCSEITGYSCFNLEGTGLVDSYQQLLEQVLGRDIAKDFYDAAESIVCLDSAEEREEKIRALLLPSATLWPVVRSLISLWYLGSWTRLPDSWYAATRSPVPGPNDAGRTHVPSAVAYIEQLSYRTGGAHPPGAKPTGHGSWSIPPVLDEAN